MENLENLITDPQPAGTGMWTIQSPNGTATKVTADYSGDGVRLQTTGSGVNAFLQIKPLIRDAGEYILCFRVAGVSDGSQFPSNRMAMYVQWYGQNTDIRLERPWGAVGMWALAFTVKPWAGPVNDEIRLYATSNGAAIRYTHIGIYSRHDWNIMHAMEEMTYFDGDTGLTLSLGEGGV